MSAGFSEFLGGNLPPSGIFSSHSVLTRVMMRLTGNVNGAYWLCVLCMHPNNAIYVSKHKHSERFVDCHSQEDQQRYGSCTVPLHKGGDGESGGGACRVSR